MTQTILLWINFVLGLAVVFHNARRIKKSNPRTWLRASGAIMGGYVAAIYFLAGVGILQPENVSFYLRWFMGVILLYIITEAQNG